MTSSTRSIKKLTDTTISIASGNYFEKIEPSEYKYQDSQLATAIEEIQKQVISQMFEMQVVSTHIDRSTAVINELLETQKKMATDIYCASTDIENTFLDSDYYENKILKENLDTINNGISSLISNIKEITKMEFNLGDTAKSLHRITDKFETDLLKETKIKSSQIVDNLLEYLVITIDNNPELALNSVEIHKEILDILIEGSDRLIAIWTNDNQGKFIYSNPEAGIDTARFRDWFNECMTGVVYISDIYISSISKSPCITIGLPIFDEDKNVAGVLGADVSVQY